MMFNFAIENASIQNITTNAQNIANKMSVTCLNYIKLKIAQNALLV